MNKKIIIGLVFLLTLLSVHAADSCFANETCTWYAYGVTGELGVNITFMYPNETITPSFPMEEQADGSYLISTNFTSIGNILGCAKAYNSTEYYATACESKTLLDRRLEEEEAMIANAFWIFILLAFNYGVIYRKWKFGGNILFIVMGIAIAYLSTAFTQLIGILIIAGGFANLLRDFFLHSEQSKKKEPIW